MFAPAWQTTARAGLRSKLAALVVRRQAPPNPRRGEVEAPLSKGDSPLRGEMSRSDRGARARRAGRVSGPGDSDGPYVTTRSRATTRQLGRGGLPPSLAPLVHNDSRQSVGAGHARPATLLCCPSTGWALPACFAATSPDGEAFLAGFARANGSLFQQVHREGS